MVKSIAEGKWATLLKSLSGAVHESKRDESETERDK